MGSGASAVRLARQRGEDLHYVLRHLLFAAILFVIAAYPAKILTIYMTTCRPRPHGCAWLFWPHECIKMGFWLPMDLSEPNLAFFFWGGVFAGVYLAVISLVHILIFMTVFGTRNLKATVRRATLGRKTDRNRPREMEAANYRIPDGMILISIDEYDRLRGAAAPLPPPEPSAPPREVLDAKPPRRRLGFVRSAFSRRRRPVAVKKREGDPAAQRLLLAHSSEDGLA